MNMNMYASENGKFGTASGDGLIGFMDSYINEKVHTHSFGEQAGPTRDTLLVYNYEGEGSLAGSIDSCDIIDDGFQTGHSYLNDLDLKFKTLADICNGKEQKQELTVTLDTPVQQEVATKQEFVRRQEFVQKQEEPAYMVQNLVSSANMATQSMPMPTQGMSMATHGMSMINHPPQYISGGMQGMTIIPDSTLMRKNYVVTTTINPVEEMVTDPGFDHQNLVATNLVNTIPRRVGVIEDASAAHQNIVVTKMVNAAGAGGISEMFMDPSIGHQNVVMTKQYSTSPRGGQGMVFSPAMAQQNTMMTTMVDGGSGGMYGMVVGGPGHAVEKNVTLTRSVHGGGSQHGAGHVAFDHHPAIHKNVTLNKSAHSGAETFPSKAGMQKARDSQSSVTSMTKVTKVSQLMQE